MDGRLDSGDDLSSTRLLASWYSGRGEALDELIRRHEKWVRQRVSQRLGPRLRARVESSDIVQEALMRFCRDGPRIQVERDGHLRRLLSVIVENTIRDTHEFFTRMRRDLAHERPLSVSFVVSLDSVDGTRNNPSAQLEEAERHAMLRLALELLPPEDRAVVLMRMREGKSFTQIGDALGTSGSAADQRYRRAIPKLERLLVSIESGDIDTTLELSGG